MTQQEVDSYNARQLSSKMVWGGVHPPVTREADLHNQIFEHCRSNGWIALHGSMSERTSRTLGEADYTILMPNGRVLFVECKTKTGKLSTAQMAMKAWMAKLGHTMHVVRSMAEFLELTK